MSPPIRDGSGSSIGSIRLGDGSEISEVRTGAGDVLFSASAIPDSAIANYSSLDDNRSAGDITSIPDRVNNNDLSGNAELLSSGINNDKTYRLDGSEIMSVSGLDFNAEPFAVLIAFKQQEALNSNKFIFDFEDSSNNVRQFGVNDNGNPSDDLGKHRGGTFGAQDNTLPTSKDVLNLLTIEGHSTDNIKIRQNGSNIVDQAIATSSQDEFILSPDRFNDGHLALDFVEITLLEGNSSVTGQDVTDEEERIANRHGITLA
jgi:hypothetical protein